MDGQGLTGRYLATSDHPSTGCIRSIDSGPPTTSRTASSNSWERHHQDLSEFGLVTDILGHLGRLVGNSVAFDSVNPVPLALAGMQVC